MADDDVQVPREHLEELGQYLEDGGVYPPDADDEDDQYDGTEAPTPRGASIRRGALAKRPKKQVRSVGKSGSKILAREKQRQALELRKGGASYAAIAKGVGYSDASAARKAVVKAFAEIVQEPAEELKVIQVERLNHMLLALWPKIQTGDERAISTGLSILDRLNEHEGLGGRPGTNVTVNTGSQVMGDAILVVDGNKDDFILAAKKMAGINADGSSAALPSAANSVPTGQGVIEGTVVEDSTEDLLDGVREAAKDGKTLYDALGPEGRKAVHDLMAPPDTPDTPGSGPLSGDFPYVEGGDPLPDPPPPTKQGKTYDFGVDPDL